MKSSFRTIPWFEYFHYSDCQVSFVWLFIWVSYSIFPSSLAFVSLQSIFKILHPDYFLPSLVSSLISSRLTPLNCFLPSLLFHPMNNVQLSFQTLSPSFLYLKPDNTVFLTNGLVHNSQAMLLPPSFNYFSFWNTYNLNNPFSSFSNSFSKLQETLLNSSVIYTHGKHVHGGGGDGVGAWLCCWRCLLLFNSQNIPEKLLKSPSFTFLLPSPVTFIFTTLNTSTSLLYPFNNPYLLHCQDLELTSNPLILTILLPSFFVPCVICKTLKDVPTTFRFPYTFHLLPFHVMDSSSGYSTMVFCFVLFFLPLLDWSAFLEE